MARSRTPKFLILICISKLLKATLLLMAAGVAHHLITHDIAKFITFWAEKFRVDPNDAHIHNVIVHLLAINKGKLELFCVGTFVYSVLYATEGIGLLLDKTWAEWMTVITTAGFIPLEIYEICRHTTWARIGLLAFNAVILVYLIYYVRRKIQRHREEKHVREQEADAAAKEKSIKGNV